MQNALIELAELVGRVLANRWLHERQEQQTQTKIATRIRLPNRKASKKRRPARKRFEQPRP
jgi:hypothetical protein